MVFLKLFFNFNCSLFYEAKCDGILNNSKSRPKAAVTLRNKDLELLYQFYKALSHSLFLNIFFFLKLRILEPLLCVNFYYPYFTYDTEYKRLAHDQLGTERWN